MSEQLMQALREHFGFNEFRPGQVPVIEHLLAGHSAAAVFPTGAGKSLCYQLPALLLDGLTLVVSPLIALMKDQIDALQRRGIAAARLDSTLDADAYRHVMQQARHGELRLLYVAPERFNNEMFRASMKQVKVALFAVDEAHCISEWGHNFRPDYLKLAGFATQCGAQRVLALTATATPRVLDDICKVFRIDRTHATRTGFYRSNLTLQLDPVGEDERMNALLANLRQRPRGPSIVYVTLQRTAEEVAADLTAAGFEASAYHAGMEDVDRTAVQDWFLASREAIVVATIAFGMGIDKADIRYVYHYNLPKSLENYSQEIGRAGRDGATAICHLFACEDDLNVLENFVYGDTPDRSAVRQLVEHIFSLDEQFDVSHYDLSSECDIRMLVVRTLLTYLELEGYLEGGTPFYSSYRFKPRMKSADILAKFEGERREFLRKVLSQSKRGRTWFTVDAAAAASAIAAPRDRVVTALEYLGRQGMLDLEAQGVRHRYRRLRRPSNLHQLADQLHQRMVQREAAELGRIRQVLDLVHLDGCQVDALGRHFGDALDQPCGHCSWCMRGKAEIGAGGGACRAKHDLNGRVTDAIARLDAKQRETLHSPQAVARFLCGVSSPAISRARLGSHPLFGSLSDVPFQSVVEAAAAQAALA